MTDKLYKRYVCSNPGCNNEEAGVWLDDKGQCADCQIAEFKLQVLEDQEDYLQTVQKILAEEEAVC